jgi:hypothetical protein
LFPIGEVVNGFILLFKLFNVITFITLSSWSSNK